MLGAGSWSRFTSGCAELPSCATARRRPWRCQHALVGDPGLPRRSALVEGLDDPARLGAAHGVDGLHVDTDLSRCVRVLGDELGDERDLPRGGAGGRLRRLRGHLPGECNDRVDGIRVRSRCRSVGPNSVDVCRGRGFSVDVGRGRLVFVARGDRCRLGSVGFGSVRLGGGRRITVGGRGRLMSVARGVRRRPRRIGLGGIVLGRQAEEPPLLIGKLPLVQPLSKLLELPSGRCRDGACSRPE